MNSTSTKSLVTKQSKVMDLTLTAMMTAMLCVLAPFSIPITNVPISLATFVVYLAALMLGTRRSMVCVGLYIMIGAVGVPVFAKWSTGAGVIAGPTGGYLIGYFLIAFFTSYLAKLGRDKIGMVILGMVLGTIGCYFIGTLWLAFQLNLSAKAAIGAGVLPFILGDSIKIILSIMIGLPMKRQLSKYLSY